MSFSSRTKCSFSDGSSVPISGRRRNIDWPSAFRHCDGVPIDTYFDQDAVMVKMKKLVWLVGSTTRSVVLHKEVSLVGGWVRRRGASCHIKKLDWLVGGFDDAERRATFRDF